MDLKAQAKSFLDATDPGRWLTYEEYARRCITEGLPAVTSNQWDVLLDMASGRQLQSVATVLQITRNMRSALTASQAPVLSNGL